MTSQISKEKKLFLLFSLATSIIVFALFGYIVWRQQKQTPVFINLEIEVPYVKKARISDLSFAKLVDKYANPQLQEITVLIKTGSAFPYPFGSISSAGKYDYNFRFTRTSIDIEINLVSVDIQDPYLATILHDLIIATVLQHKDMKENEQSFMSTEKKAEHYTLIGEVVANKQMQGNPILDIQYE